MYGLKLADIALNRKMLSEIAGTNPEEFKNLVATANKAIEENSKKTAAK
jgi:large subunit ribosomal protein L20